MAGKYFLSIVINGVDKVSKTFGRITKNLNAVGKSLNKIGKGLSLKVSAPIIGIGIASLRSAAQIETMTVAFESLTGSADQAKKTVKDLIDFTAKTPFQLEQVGGAARQLLAAGIAVDNINDKLLILGDIAAGANIPLNDMASIFVKIKNKQKAQAEEINQLSERGIPIIRELAKVMKVPEKAIFKLASQGKVSFELIQKAMINMRSEGGIFANQMEKQSATLAGIFSTLKDNIALAGAEIGKAVIVSTDLKEKMKGLIDVAQKLAGWFKALPAPMRDMIVFGALIVAAIGPMLIALGQMAFGLNIAILGFMKMGTVLLFGGKLIFGFSKLLFFLSKPILLLARFALPLLITGFKAFAAVLIANPIGAIIAGVVALAAAAYLIIKNWDKVKEFWTNLWEGITGIFDGAWLKISGIVNKIKGAVSFITNNAVTRAIGGLFGGGGNETGAENNRPITGAANAQNTIRTERTEVNVNLNNLPRGTRVDTGNNGGGKGVNINQGFALAGP